MLRKYHHTKYYPNQPNPVSTLVWPKATKFSMVTHEVWGIFLENQARPISWAQRSKMTIKFGMVKHLGKWHMLYGRSRADPGLVMGAEVEAPQTPRGVGFGEGVSPSPTGRGLGKGLSPLPRKFLNFYPEMAHFCAFCNLQQ